MPCSTRWAWSSETCPRRPRPPPAAPRSARGEIAALPPLREQPPKLLRLRKGCHPNLIQSLRDRRQRFDITASSNPPPFRDAGPNSPAAAKYRQNKRLCQRRRSRPRRQSAYVSISRGHPYEMTPVVTAPDVQASVPGNPGEPVARRRHRRREGRPGLGQRRRAALSRQPRVLRRPQPAAGRRPHVALRGGRRRGDRRGRARRGLPRRDARRPHRRAGPRAPARPARRGLSRRPLPGDRRRPNRALAPRRSTGCSAPPSPPSAASGR